MKEESIMKTITCPGCGGSFKKLSDDFTWRCELCDAYEAYMYNGHVQFVNRFETDEEFKYDTGYHDERPPACTGCGSDCYPDCRDSCGLFDD